MSTTFSLDRRSLENLMLEYAKAELEIEDLEEIESKMATMTTIDLAEFVSEQFNWKILPKD